MNLPLHYGLLGSLEAGLIALVIGFLMLLIWHRIGQRTQLSPGHVLGWSCLIAVAIGAGYDIWNLVYTSVVNLESPLYARLALQHIHDPDQLGGRAVLEVAGALAGVAIGWRVFVWTPDDSSEDAS